MPIVATTPRRSLEHAGPPIRLALDFLNTVATPVDVPVEWLRDGHDLIDWFEWAGAIRADVAARFRASSDRRALDRVAARARECRDWLRGFVARHAGKALTPDSARAIGPLNELLSEDTSYPLVPHDRAGREARPRSGHWHINPAGGPEVHDPIDREPAVPLRRTGR